MTAVTQPAGVTTGLPWRTHRRCTGSLDLGGTPSAACLLLLLSLPALTLAGTRRPCSCVCAQSREGSHCAYAPTAEHITAVAAAAARAAIAQCTLICMNAMMRPSLPASLPLILAPSMDALLEPNLIACARCACRSLLQHSEANRFRPPKGWPPRIGQNCCRRDRMHGFLSSVQWVRGSSVQCQETGL